LKYHSNPSAHETVAGIEQIIDRPESAQYRQDLDQAIVTLWENLDLEQVLRQIRSAMETLSVSNEARGRLEILYGSNLFKCPRSDCSQFFEGFSELNVRDQHQKKHDRPFYCTFDGCLAAQTGFVDSLQLQQHISRIHDPFEVSHFPELVNSSRGKIELAIKSSNLVLLEHCLEKRGSGPFKYGWWVAAMRQHDDEVINLLARYTNFSTTRGQVNVLDTAIKEKRLDLVQRFSQDYP